jgi:hypothetical protein
MMNLKLKKLSRSQGRILVKLIHRQTGTTTYELVKHSKAVESFWSSTAASMFDINLKSEFVLMNLMKTFDRNHTSKSFESGDCKTNHQHIPDIDTNDFWKPKHSSKT